MKKKKIIAASVIICALILLTGGILLAVNLRGSELSIVLDGALSAGSTMEYTGKPVQFPLAHVEDSNGDVISYDVGYQIIDTKDNSTLEDEYASFDLKTGDYILVYTYKDDKKVTEEIPFRIKDTTSPVITFSKVPNGLFLQDIEKEEALKLPQYLLSDASEADGIELEKKLYFKSDAENDFTEYSFREINSSYQAEKSGRFRYELTAVDAYGNSTTESVEWKIKDRDWKPFELPGEGYLADYASEGYTNYIEGGDANQYYQIGTDYRDEWLEEYEGASGVFKIDMGFNNAAGYGNNTIKLHFAKSFTQKEMEGKYLAVRILVEGEHLQKEMLFGGNNVEFREADATTRAFTTAVTGLETGVWKTYYIDAATVQAIGMYPNGKYNPETTFYEGGDPASCLQLCFQREGGYTNRMALYIDSITLAEKLPETEISIQGKTASWKAVNKAVGYRINIKGEEIVVMDTKVSLPGNKGYIRVMPLGDGALSLDGEETTAVYGIDPGSKLAAFDDALYLDLFSDQLKFSTAAEHMGYQPKSYTGEYTDEGITLELGTGNWGVCTGIRFLFPQARAKGDNTTLVLNMYVGNVKYGSMRVYDQAGELLQNIKLTPENTGRYFEFKIDLSGYDKKLQGLNFIFGPNNMTLVPDGVTLKFKEIYYENTYYSITVDGQTMLCAGERTLEPHYTQGNLVQFRSFFNFGVSVDDTPLSFEGTVLLDGRKLGKNAFSVVGYPKTDTICFKVPHEGKILTIMKDSIIYYGGKAVKVGETFNAKWNKKTDGSEWITVAKVPETPADEYVTVDGKQKKIVNKTALKPHYTADTLVQFADVNDFGVTEDNTPLSFKGTVLVDGVKVKSVDVVGYPAAATVCFQNMMHKDKVLTIMKDSVIYHGEEAVVITETFNKKWNGTDWEDIADIPKPPKDEYITVGGSQKKVVNKTALTPGFTTERLVQFVNVYDFQVEDNTPLFFQGTVLLNGKSVSDVVILGYRNTATICLNDVALEGQVLTILKDSVIYYRDQAVVITETFNKKWVDGVWTNVADIPDPDNPDPDNPDPDIPEPDEQEILALAYRWGNDTLIQMNTDLPADTPLVNFTASDNGCEIDQSGNRYQQVGWIGMDNADGTIVLTFHFNSKFAAGQTYVLPKGAVFGFTDDRKYVLDKDYTFTYDGANWTMEAVIPEEMDTLSLACRWGNDTLIQMNTDLPADTPLANFTASDNGCEIDQSGNQYQQVGWIGMDNADGTIVLNFHFNSKFTAGQTYVLPKGAVFGFTDGRKYVLDKDYTFTYDGSGWQQ